MEGVFLFIMFLSFSLVVLSYFELNDNQRLIISLFYFLTLINVFLFIDFNLENWYILVFWSVNFGLYVLGVIFSWRIYGINSYFFPVVGMMSLYSNAKFLLTGKEA
jgi:hypothetical protein